MSDVSASGLESVIIGDRPVPLRGVYHPGATADVASDAASLAALAHAEERLHSVVSLTSDAIVAADDAFRITLFNAAAERIFGYSSAEMLGQPIDVLLSDDARASHREQMEAFRAAPPDSWEARGGGEMWGRRRGGELFPVEATVSRIAVAGTTTFIAVIRDVSLQRRAEQECEAMLMRAMEARAAAERAGRRGAFLARASEVLHSSLAYTETFGALLRYIVPELATYCIVDVVNESGTVSRLHVVHADPEKQPVADRLSAYPRTQAAYMTRRAIMHGEAELVTHVSDDLLRTRAEDEEHLALFRALAPASYMIVPLRSRQHVLGALLFARDASAPPYTADDLSLAVELAQRAASALDNAQLYDRAQRAIRARDDVLGVVSHDLRNPLTVISMCVTSLLTHGFGEEARSREALRTMQQSTQWAQRLIQDLLDVATIDAGGLSLTVRLEDPLLLVTRAALLFEEMAAERGVRIRTELPEHLPRIRADGDRLLQALGNLIGNALKFTPPGGEVRIGAAEDAEGVRLYVIDSGPGIPEQDVPKVFDRFWTAPRTSRVRGTGMGLAIVRGIVDAHGGRVWVERADTGGAAFNVLLPAAPDA